MSLQLSIKIKKKILSKKIYPEVQEGAVLSSHFDHGVKHGIGNKDEIGILNSPFTWIIPDRTS